LLDCFVACAPRNDGEVTVYSCDRHAAAPRNGDVASPFPSLRLPRRYALHNEEEAVSASFYLVIAIAASLTLLAMTGSEAIQRPPF
jgi:hypothetical protein